MKITHSMCTAKRMIPASHSTQFESFFIVSTKTGKKKIFEKSVSIVIPRRPGITFEQRSNVREPSVCLPLTCRQETLLGILNTTNRQ